MWLPTGIESLDTEMKWPSRRAPSGTQQKTSKFGALIASAKCRVRRRLGGVTLTPLGIIQKVGDTCYDGLVLAEKVSSGRPKETSRTIANKIGDKCSVPI